MPFIIAALKLTPSLVAAGEDIAQFVDWAITVWSCPTGPQPTDWEILHNKEASLRAQLA